MTALKLTAFVVGIVGCAAALKGVAMLSVPVAYIAGGLTAVAWSGFTARALARRKG